MSKNPAKAFQLLLFIVTLLPISMFAQADLGVVGLVSPGQQSCYGNGQTVIVRVRNFSLAAHNFATTPVTVNMNISGPAGSSSPSVIVNTGALPAGDSLNVVVLTNFNMSLIGAYVFTANASVPADVNTANDAMQPTTIGVQALAVGTIVSSNPSYCGSGGSPTLTLTGGGGGNIQWQESPTSAVGSWVNVGGNFTSYTPAAAITATRYYRAYRSCNGAGDTSLTSIVNVFNPQVVSTTPGSTCGSGPVTLTAIASPFSNVKWYSAPTGGALLGTGSTFVTQSLSATTVFYAKAWSNSNVIAGIKIGDLPVCGSPVSSVAIDQPLRFTTTKPVVLQSAYVIPATTNLTVTLRNQGSTVNLLSSTFTFTSAQVGTLQRIELAWSLGPGNFQITNTTGGLWKISSPACSYPFVTPSGSMSVTGSGTSSVSGSSTNFYNGFYHININEDCESSAVAVQAQVNSITSITQQPVNISTCAGSTVNIVVGAQGTNLSYQWRKNGVNIPNSNNDTLTFNPVSVSDTGHYDVVITGTCGSVLVSNSNTMTVASTCAWLGSQSDEWNRPANWEGGIPTSSSNITISAGTPFQPLISSGNWDVKSMTINPGASLSMWSGSTLNIYGDLITNGMLPAGSGSFNFKGSTLQNVGGLIAGNVTVNGAGISLTGNMNVLQTLVLTNGNINLGANNLTLNNSTAGSAASHIVTNSSGTVVAKQIDLGFFTIPVGPSSTSYNPVTISKGASLDYSVKVATGFSTPIDNPAIAVNRTWTINPSSAPISFVDVILQYEDSHMNAMGQPGSMMFVGFHDGSVWKSTGGILPSGSSTARKVSFSTKLFGTVVMSNAPIENIFTGLPATMNPDISSIKLLPGLVNTSAVLKVVSTKALAIKWNVIDAQGHIVMSFDHALHQGQNDIQLKLQQLSPGVYSLNGISEKGSTEVVRFVKQ